MTHRPHKKRKLIRADRIFMGMPVRDATESILVQPTRDDIDKATKGDPENCAYAQCVKRMLKTSIVFVYHTVAYVERLDENGQTFLARYLIRDGTRTYLENFDTVGDKVNPAGFSLKAPIYSQTLDYKASLRKHWRHTGQEAIWKETRKRKLQEEKRTGKKLIKYRVSAKKTLGSFRDGTGCVKFIGTRDGVLGKHDF